MPSHPFQPPSVLALALLVGLSWTSGLVTAADPSDGISENAEISLASLTVVESSSVQPVEDRGGTLQDALAHAVIERNVAASQRDSLLQRQWLIIAYALVASLVALWFMHTTLMRRPLPAAATGRMPITTRVATTTTQRKSTNATITIRNAATQEPEIVDRVATRKLFAAKPRPTETHPLMPALVPTFHAPMVPPAPLIVSPPTRPQRLTATEYHDYTPTDHPQAQIQIGSSPSILMAPGVDDVVPESEADDETTQVRIERHGRVLVKQGFSLLEVMISLTILATVLTAISGGIYSLSSFQRATSEEVLVRDAMQMWGERVMGAEWEWLGRDRTDDPLKGAWSWERPETTDKLVAGEFQPLREGGSNLAHDASAQLLDHTKSGIQNLKFYLEYYRPTALEVCFTPADGAAAKAAWKELRNSYRLARPIDLRQHTDAVVVRLTATWSASDGGTRRRELVLARTP